MRLRILKNDLKRKKTINMILVLFIILSTVFVASGINNVIAVLNGTEGYLKKAKVGDCAIVTMGKDVVGGVDKAVKNMKEIKDYRIETVIFGAKDNVKKIDGTICESKNATCFQSLSDAKICFFDLNNQQVDQVEPGHVYVTSTFLGENDLSKGDVIVVKIGSIRRKLIIDGKLKDAFLGSSFTGNTRFLMNDQDYKAFLKDEDTIHYSQGEIAYFDVNDIKEFVSRISEIPNVNFKGTKSVLKMLYAIENITAILVLILSICLMVVSFVVLRFSIQLTLTEEFREIGVMKAIGLNNKDVRNLYVWKYLSLSIAGGVIGFFASLPLGNKLLEYAANNMVIESDSGIFANLIGAIIVIVIIPLYAYLCTKKIKKISPISAIRSGQTGERYVQKTTYSIKKSHLETNFFMAVNDLLSNPRKYLTVVISFFLCTSLMLVIANTTATMKSDRLLSSLSMRSDLYITDVGTSMKFMNGHTKEELLEYFDTLEKDLKELDMPGKLRTDVFYNYKVSFKGKEYLFSCNQGINAKITDYDYEKGTVLPRSKEEVLITPIISELTGAKIGDTITIDFETEKIDCMVTGYCETMNQMGEVIRLHQDAPTDFSHVSTIAQFQIEFDDNPSVKLIDERKEKLKNYYNNDEIMNASEYCMDCVEVADILTMVQYLLLGITLLVVILVTILMERSFIADEKSQIATLKAIGFKGKDVIAWHTYRFCLVGLVAAVLACVASIPLTKLCITPIFKMMGVAKIDYKFDIMRTFLVYPGIVFGTTVIISFIVARYTRKITCRDTANIE